jgi:hypothetical protein
VLGVEDHINWLTVPAALAKDTNIIAVANRMNRISDRVDGIGFIINGVCWLGVCLDWGFDNFGASSTFEMGGKVVDGGLRC